jgi:uncharacterized protein YndB with AHSA1/START domain
MTKSQRRIFSLAIPLFVFCPLTLRAQVVDSAAHGFTVKNVVSVLAPPEKVYQQLVMNVGKWWNSAHSWSGDAHNLFIDDKAGGCFCEKLKGGGSAQHMTVVFADRGKTLRMVGALGPLQSMGVAGSMTWALTKSENGTKVELTYTVGGYLPGGLASLSVPVDNVLREQLLRLKKFTETGKPE